MEVEGTRRNWTINCNTGQDFWHFWFTIMHAHICK